MNRRTLALLAGILALGLGAVALVAPGVAPLSADRVLLVVVGLVALAAATREILGRRHVDLDETRTPDPERSIATPQPGDDFRSTLDQFLERRGVRIGLDRIPKGLTAVAVAVQTRFDGRSEEEARERIAAGTWTDDAYAATFLGDDVEASVGLRRKVRDAIAGQSHSQRRIRHTIGAIESIVDGGRRSSPPDRESRAVPDDGDDGGREPDDGAATDRPASTKDWLAFEESETIRTRESRSTERWSGVNVVALVGIGVGVVVQQPAVLLAGVVGIGYAAYARSGALAPGPVSIERSLDTETPATDEVVTVTVTVRNESGQFLPDVRIVDGVPKTLAVEEGSPRRGVALGPGSETSFTYRIRARRGVHEFGPTLIVGRDLAGATESAYHYDADTTLTCVPSLSPGSEPLALRGPASGFGGQQVTERTGAGIEFSATREYRPGDPMGRIDWNRRARTRELTTVEFREERAASVVLLVDARPAAYVSPTGETTHAVDRAVAAAGQLFADLEGRGHRVGIAAAGFESPWIQPGSGVEHREAVRERLARDDALGPEPTASSDVSWGWERTLRNRLTDGSQIVFLTPLADEFAGRIARRFDERGFPVTVVSPDPTGGQRPSHRLARVGRRLRVSTLREAGVPVIEWAWDEPLDRALARHAERRGP